MKYVFNKKVYDTEVLPQWAQELLGSMKRELDYTRYQLGQSNTLKVQVQGV